MGPFFEAMGMETNLRYNSRTIFWLCVDNTDVAFENGKQTMHLITPVEVSID